MEPAAVGEAASAVIKPWVFGHWKDEDGGGLTFTREGRRGVTIRVVRVARGMLDEAPHLCESGAPFLGETFRFPYTFLDKRPGERGTGVEGRQDPADYFWWHEGSYADRAFSWAVGGEPPTRFLQTSGWGPSTFAVPRGRIEGEEWRSRRTEDALWREEARFYRECAPYGVFPPPQLRRRNPLVAQRAIP